VKKYLGRKKLLRIYIDSSDKYDGQAVWQKLLSAAKEDGLAGATVFKASAGIGVHTEVHTFEIWSLSQKLPLIIEIIDDRGKIESFLEKRGDLIGEGLVALSDVEVLRYKNCTG